MGVPAFYRWLLERYPKIIVDCVEQHVEMIGDVEIPIDLTAPNPNGVEFNNLYLDMNGIIHPCFHPEDRPAPTTENEVFFNIFEYIDRLIGIARPRTLIYMAIDGVAPRAKMNQQRSRRFQAAQDRLEQAKVEEELRDELERRGVFLPKPGQGETFDSNVITPGTEFMERLAIALQWYVHKRLNEEPAWANLSVILSDSNTPGEGEHKFMQFVREQRERPGWNTNTVHCVYGLDADLIHLALASHEPHTYILREVVFFGNKSGPPRNGQDRNGLGNGNSNVPDESEKPDRKQKPYQFLKINVLREYLALEFSDIHVQQPLDTERLIDDFVFMCFFVGNDFLPHMPTLEIREQGIELMLHCYKQMFPRLGGYLTSGAHLNLERIEAFIQTVGGYEDKIFQARARKLNAEKRRFLQRKEEAEQAEKSNRLRLTAPSRDNDNDKAPTKPKPAEQNSDAAKVASPASSGASNKGAAAALKARLAAKRSAPEGDDTSAEHAGIGVKARKTEAEQDVHHGGDGDDAKEDVAGKPGSSNAGKSRSGAPESTATKDSDGKQGEHAEEYKIKLKETMKGKSDRFAEMLEHEESIRLGEEGWKGRYYQQKFGLPPGPEQDELVRSIVQEYVKGLVWVMRYYFDGVASWRWFFPYHYAPFASDLVGLRNIKTEFDHGEPFEPFNQLMGVLPSASKHALPEQLRHLFDSEDSPIVDFYPHHFTIDVNGKRFKWQGVTLLPFIDERRLLDATGPIIAELPMHLKRRNQRRIALIIARAGSAVGDMLLNQAMRVRQAAVLEKDYNSQVEVLQAYHTGGLSGQVMPCLGEACPVTFSAPPFKNFTDIPNNSVVTAMYKDPPHQRHNARIVSGTILEHPVLDSFDKPQDKPLWCMQHELRNGGNGYGGRGGDWRSGYVEPRPSRRLGPPGGHPGPHPGGIMPTPRPHWGQHQHEGPPRPVAHYNGHYAPHAQPPAHHPQMWTQPMAQPMAQPGMPYGTQQVIIVPAGAPMPTAPGMAPMPGRGGGSFFASMRPSPARGPPGHAAPAGSAPPRPYGGGRGGTQGGGYRPYGGGGAGGSHQGGGRGGRSGHDPRQLR